jgi:hypothetical protein
MTTIFPAKISWWLFGPILLALTANIGYDLLHGAWLAALFSAGVAALVLYVVLGTRYTLTDTELLIQSGPFGWRVPVQQIKRVVPSRNPLSSPAPSLDRLKISYNKYDWVLISPRDKAAFLDALKQLNPTIHLS